MASEEIITTKKWKIPQPLWRCGTSTWFSFYGNHGEANCWWCTRVTSPTGSKQTTTTWITLYKNHSNYHQPEPWSLQPGNEVWGRLQRFRKPARQWWDPQPDGPPGHQQGDPDLPVSIHGTLVHNHLKHSPCCGKVMRTSTGRLRWEVPPALTWVKSGRSGYWPKP